MGNYQILTGIARGTILPEYNKGAYPKEDGSVLLDDGVFHHMYYGSDEVERVPGKHEGDYDPQHRGELDPDAWDRATHQLKDRARHLLDTGVN